MHPTDAELMCTIEETGVALGEKLVRLKEALEFAALVAAGTIGQVDRAMNFSVQLDQVLAEYNAFQSTLRRYIARARMRARQAGP